MVHEGSDTGQVTEQPMKYELTAELFAEVHGHNQLCIKEAISDWIRKGDGSRMDPKIVKKFRDDIQKICDEAHVTWKIKGSSIGLSEDEEHDIHDSYLEDQEKRWKGLIFCDLDGVLADFREGVREVFHQDFEEIPHEEVWSRLSTTPNFYSNLPWTKDGKQLWESLQPLKPTIISAAPKDSWAANQKIEWVKKNLGPEVKTVITTQKQVYCQDTHPEIILIDDTIRWCKLWEDAGGTSILHADTKNTLLRLRELGVPIDPQEGC